MKKNISINLFGTLYAIDEDAYNLLERYLGSMKSYFSRQEGGEEIADDIEHRVAELLWEKKQQGMEAVNIDTIKGIIAKIGNPAEIDEKSSTGSSQGEDAPADASPGDESASSQDPKGGSGFSGGPRFRMGGFRYNFKGEKVEYDEMTNLYERLKLRLKNRHLYRDPKDKLLGGVLSGLSRFFDTNDPLWWRLGFVALFVIMWYFDIFALTLPFLYTLLWVVVPEPHTPEDRLRMMGREVNPENLNAQILSDTANAAEPSGHVEPSGGSTPLKVLFGLFLGVLLIPFGFLLLVLLVFIILAVSFMCGFAGMLIPFNVADNEFAHIPDFVQANSTSIWLCILFGIFAIGLPIFGIVRMLFVRAGALSRGTKITLVLVWLLSLVMMIMTLINNGTRFARFMDTHTRVTYEYTDEADDDEYAADSIDTDTILLSDTTYSVPVQPADSVPPGNQSEAASQ